MVLVFGGAGASQDDDQPTRSGVEVAEVTPTPTPEPTATPIPTDTPEPTPSPEPTPEPEHSYVINVNTGVFHLEGCQHERRMSEGNKQYVTATRSYMLAQGYNPCDTCNP